MALLKAGREPVSSMLLAADGLRFSDIDAIEIELRRHISDLRAREPDDENVLQDLFVLDRYLDLVVAYLKLWQKLHLQEFSDSWISLQDAIDNIRVIRRFSGISASHYEQRLLEIESAYPYNLFFSVGMRVGVFSCSLCNKNIDSFDCEHRRGELYRGQMAVGVAKEIKKLDHIAIVKYPADKRCVVQLDDTSEGFKILRYISTLLEEGKIKPSEFRRLEWSKRRTANPEHRELPRNKPCYCGSGKKFKRCCIEREYILTDHVDIVAEMPMVQMAWGEGAA